jgi:non-heme chloroperoxidase
MAFERSDKSALQSRRDVLLVAGAAAVVSGLPLHGFAAATAATPSPTKQRRNPMTSITTKDGTEIFYKD